MPQNESLTTEQAEADRVVRTFRRYTDQERRDILRATGRSEAAGEHSYTHPDLPGQTFRTRQGAARAAVRETA